MEEAKRRKLVVLVLSLAVIAVFSPIVQAGGSLDPSAPPGVIMKSLDEVEPRIPIKASDFPLTITQPGSYYLTEDVTFADTAHHAITIVCNDVTIDLKGYTITGPDSTTYSGIYMSSRQNIEIRNGTVRDFYNGIYEFASPSGGHRAIHIRAVSNTNYGIYLRSNGNLIKDCTAVENGCGIWSSFGMITNNTACYNTQEGIYADSGSTVSGNTACFNSQNGIYTAGPCTVTGNTATYNKLNGLYISDSSQVVGNNCSYNGWVGDGAGICVVNTSNRIEGNHVSFNDRGIDVDNVNNLIVRNSAVSNTVEYDIVVGNKVGTISTDPTTANAWANFDL